MLKDFKIYTYCTDTNNEIFKKLTSQLDIEVLPILTNWTWDFYPKSLSVYETLKTLKEDTIVLICDSYDVLPVKGTTNEKLFQHIKDNLDLDKVTFNAEKNCYPNVNLKPLYPNIDSEWKYLNGGIYVGSAKKIINMLNNLLPIMSGTIDQEIFSKAFVEKNFDITIDFECKVFQTLFMIEETDLSFDDNILKNNKTNTFPLLVHGNGKSDMSKFL